MADLASLGDAELVAAARAGNREAFACLADRHRGMVAALAWRLLGSDDLVADVTQEATVAALVGLGRLRSASQFGAWYAGIALNVARRWLREVSAAPPMTYQLAANLLTAAGSRLTEVRTTRLVEGVFYAVVVLEAPGRVVEVDARPSDALNLAVVAGAPVRVDAAVLGHPDVDCHPEWEQYPARWRDLAAEERQRRAETLARHAREHERPA